MSKSYMQVRMYVSGNGQNGEHLYLETDSLDGEEGMVTLYTELEKDKRVDLGTFDAEQLITAIKLIKDASENYTFGQVS